MFNAPLPRARAPLETKEPDDGVGVVSPREASRAPLFGFVQGLVSGHPRCGVSPNLRTP